MDFGRIKGFILRNRVAVAFAVALCFAGSAAVAQIVTIPYLTAMTAADAFQDIASGNPSTTNTYVTSQQIRSWVLGQNSQHLAAPTPTITTSICGGSTATLKGTDLSGQVTEGSTASTSCVLTFATAFVTAPECFVSIDNVTDSALKCHTTTTTMTVTQTSASSNVLNYLVVGLSGG